MDNNNEFRKYAVKHAGFSSLNLDRYNSLYNNYISPTMIEERQIKVASMDVLSRIRMERIILSGVRMKD